MQGFPQTKITEDVLDVMENSFLKNQAVIKNIAAQGKGRKVLNHANVLILLLGDKPGFGIRVNYRKPMPQFRS